MTSPSKNPNLGQKDIWIIYEGFFANPPSLVVKYMYLLAKMIHTTVKLGNKECFDEEQIGVKEPFPMTKCYYTS